MIAAITFSLMLTGFLAAYIVRSVIFIFIARNAIKSFLPTSTRRQSQVITSNGNSQNSGISFLNNSDTGITDIHAKVFTKSEAESSLALDRQLKRIDYEPFVSILIASYNERQVIERLMKSCTALTYNQNNFEILVIDDSEDETFQILKLWEKKIQNLKVIHRGNRKGWKGGALNVALYNMSTNSSYALIVDADNILASHTLEDFIACFEECTKKESIVAVIQGYPVPVYYNNIEKKIKSSPFDQIRDHSNWISNAIDFRLAERNLIEFVAKRKLSLPVQITGSLFMMKSEVIKSLGFSEDLTEDWDLTLDLYLFSNRKVPRLNCLNQKNRQQKSNIVMSRVFYDPSLTSYSYAITKFGAYFRQRMRVSEGHTRGFRKNIFAILISKIKLRDKIEFFLMGLQYSKFIAVAALIMADFILLLSNGIDFAISNNFIKTSLLIQAATLSIAIGINFIALDAFKSIRSYKVIDILHLLFLTICTIPAFLIGSLCGFFRGNGIFYKTERNSD